MRRRASARQTSVRRPGRLGPTDDDGTGSVVQLHDGRPCTLTTSSSRPSTPTSLLPAPCLQRPESQAPRPAVSHSQLSQHQYQHRQLSSTPRLPLSASGGPTGPACLAGAGPSSDLRCARRRAHPDLDAVLLSPARRKLKCDLGDPDHPTRSVLPPCSSPGLAPHDLERRKTDSSALARPIQSRRVAAACASHASASSRPARPSATRPRAPSPPRRARPPKLPQRKLPARRALSSRRPRPRRPARPSAAARAARTTAEPARAWLLRRRAPA